VEIELPLIVGDSIVIEPDRLLQFCLGQENSRMGMNAAQVSFTALAKIFPSCVCISFRTKGR
jgi:hypothetical protein